MSELSWRIRFTAGFAIGCAVLGGWACGGGGGGSSPTAPAIVDISGRYSGGHNVEIIANCGCAPVAWPEVPEVKTEWDIWQNIAVLEGSYFIEWRDLSWVPNSSRCEFTGTTSDFEFAISTTACDAEEYLMECADGSSRRLIRSSLNWEGRLGGDRLYGNWAGDWDCIDPSNGQELGVFTLSGDIYMVPI